MCIAKQSAYAGNCDATKTWPLCSSFSLQRIVKTKIGNVSNVPILLKNSTLFPVMLLAKEVDQ
jgi:hypothetical protein